MSRKHRHASPILVLSLATLAAGGCATDMGLNALERAIGSLDKAFAPDSVFVLNPLYVAQQQERMASLSVASAPEASFSSSAEETLGTSLALGDDECKYVPLGFAFSFYGRELGSTWVCANGNANFTTKFSTSFNDFRATLPNGHFLLAAPATSDWVPDGANNVYYQTVGIAPSRRFIVTWNNLRNRKSTMNGPRSTFRLILHETSNLVELHYPSLIRELNVTAAKAGISGGSTNYIVIASGAQLFDLSGTSVCFTPTDPASYEVTREPCPILAPPNTAPVADAAGPYEADEGSLIHFDGTTSWDAEGDALTYAWSFGDGATASEGFTSHSYPDNGEYPVLLSVTDPHGLTSEAATSAIVRNVNPAISLASAGSGMQIASFGASAPLATIVSGETATISATFADPGLGDAPWRWSVDWGNGLVDVGTTVDQSAPIVVERRLLAPGTHTVTLVVEDKDGGRSTVFGTVVVNRVSLDIDVKPGSDDNTLNTRSYGKFWVAILTTESENPAESVDASTVIVPSVRFGGAAVDDQGRGIPRTKLEDVDGDGDLDLLLQFETQDLVATGALKAFTRSIELRASLSDGREVSGSDEVRVVR
jgi:PKD repeat protein